MKYERKEGKEMSASAHATRTPGTDRFGVPTLIHPTPPLLPSNPLFLTTPFRFFPSTNFQLDSLKLCLFTIPRIYKNISSDIMDLILTNDNQSNFLLTQSDNPDTCEYSFDSEILVRLRYRK